MDIQSLSRSSWNYFSENVESTLNSTEKKVLVFALSIFSVLALGYYFYRFCTFDKKKTEEDLIEEEEIEFEKTEVLEEEQKTDTFIKLPDGRTQCLRDNVVEVGDFNKEGKLEGEGQRYFFKNHLIAVHDLKDPKDFYPIGNKDIQSQRGFFKNGELNGKGEIQFIDRRIYEGDFTHGILLEGEKNYLNVKESNVDLERGWFVDDELTGEGEIKFRNGKIQQGTFEKGILKTMHVFVKSLGGQTITLSVGIKATVDDFKNEIEKKEGTPCSQQRLLYAGKQLEDGKKLEAYGIVEESTVHLALKLRGD